MLLARVTMLVGPWGRLGLLREAIVTRRHFSLLRRLLCRIPVGVSLGLLETQRVSISSSAFRSALVLLGDSLS